MVRYTFEKSDVVVELPDDCLTTEQFEDCLRMFLEQGTDSLDFNDHRSIRKLSEAISGVPQGQIPLTPTNFKTQMELYSHIAKLLEVAQHMGDELVNEVEAKKESAERKTRAPRKKRASQSR